MHSQQRVKLHSTETLVIIKMFTISANSTITEINQKPRSLARIGLLIRGKSARNFLHVYLPLSPQNYQHHCFVTFNLFSGPRRVQLLPVQIGCVLGCSSLQRRISQTSWTLTVIMDITDAYKYPGQHGTVSCSKKSSPAQSHTTQSQEVL
jgi:hypothetical protein